ncbi:MAG: ATP-dependent DNA helicase [Patescibacteria group bacterium]
MKKDVKLDIHQFKAVNHGKGPLLIIAGAGTGKTTVITERIKNLIIDRKIPSSNILALTFTEKAAFEMQERVDILLPYGYTNLGIYTFHSFCDKILRDEAYTIGLDPNYKLISESESVLLLRRHLFDLDLKIFKPLGNPTKFLDALLTHFSRLKDEDITWEEYLKWAKKQKSEEEKKQYLELANAYKKYEEIKIKESVMDFSDLISNTLLVLRRRSNILKRYQKQFKYVMVDEFQDTNFSQNELAMLLAGKDKNITVVADDDQSIYRFRGAAVSNVLQFRNNFPNTKVIVLNNNYRSSQTILDASYNLIQHNNPNRLEIAENINKKLSAKGGSRSAGKNGKNIKLIHTQRAEDEADEIAKEIKKLKNNYDYKEIAILVRANNHSQSVSAALQRHRIPYQFLGTGYLFQQEEIKDLIAYLTFLTNLFDTVSLFRVLSMNIFNFPVIELSYLLSSAKKKNLSLFETIQEKNLNFLSKSTQNKIDNFTSMVKKHLEKSKKESAGQILYYFLVDSGLFKTFQNINSLSQEQRIQNIAKFFDRVKTFETERADSNIYILIEWLNLMLQMGESPSAVNIDIKDRNAVNILTVHSSKGLEFKVVFLINLVSERFPTKERSEKIPIPRGIIKEKLPEKADFHLEEERRLFYVGMTRAKEILYFTASDYYGIGKRTKKLSPFIYESLPKFMLEEKIFNNTKKLPLVKQLSSYQKPQKKEEKTTPLKINRITYSNLQMFDICPLHYRAKVILNIPTPKSFVQSFGISLHNTLYHYYKLVLEDKPPSLNKFLEILKYEWINEGYENKKHEKEQFLEGVKIIKKFYKTEGNPPIKPLGIEMSFSFLLKNGVKVSGKIDRIDKKGSGIEIIDYKTGLDNPKADKAHRLQLEIYALAAIKVKDSILNHNPGEITLTLHFLEGNSKKTMTFKKQELERLEDDLIAKISEIEKSDFKCSKNILCKNCEYKMLCQT